MRSARTTQLLFLLAIILSSCSIPEEEFSLSSYDRKILSALRKGDTLYFDGSDKKIDTVVILGLDSSQKREPGWIMAKPAYNEVFVAIKWFPGGRIIGAYYDSATQKTDTEYYELISITRFPQNHKVDYSFYYKDFTGHTEGGLGMRHSDTLLINNFLLTNYFIIVNDTTTSADDSTVQRLYWTESAGLVGYRCRNGVYYLRRQSKTGFR